MHYIVIDLHLQILLQINGMQKVCVCHILSNILPLYLSFIKGRRYNILTTKMLLHCESIEGGRRQIGHKLYSIVCVVNQIGGISMLRRLRGIKKIHVDALVLAKIFQYMFVHQKDNPHNPPTKVKRTRKEVQTTLKNKKKTIVDFPRSVFKRKNKVEERGTSSSIVKKEHESTYSRHKK